MALTVVIGRVGHPWEDTLLSRMDDQPGIAAVTQCRTVVELLVSVELEAPHVVVVDEGFPRLTEALARLRALTRVVIVGRGPTADVAAQRLELAALLGAADVTTPGTGRIITVWGPPGSWGTTSVAVGLARSLSRRTDTLLVDANVHAPSVGDLLNVPLGGLLNACLSVDRGAAAINPVALSARLHVLSGVDPAVYPAVHSGAMQQVLQTARSRFGHILLDVDSAIDPAGEIGLVPDWTTATAVGLRAADHVVIVVGESEIAQQRLWRSLPAAADLMRGRATIVVNRCSDPRRTTTRLARRLGDFLPEAAVGWIGMQITQRALAPIVDELVDEVGAGAG